MLRFAKSSIPLTLAAAALLGMLAILQPGGTENDLALAAPLNVTYTTAISDTWVTDPISGVQLYTRILQPDPALYPGESFPTVVLVPGGLGAGAPQVERPNYQDLAAQGFVVIGFNAPGRGTGAPGNLVSGGTEDCNGFAGQNALKAVIEYVAALPNVDTGNIGVQTSSYGITMGAGALGRYPGLPVKYLVDIEGPSNNLISTFYYTGQERNHLCGHWSVISDTSPANLDWWLEREAYRYIGDFQGYYLRAQGEIDHAQPPGVYTHTLEMNNTAVISGVPWVRVNGEEIGNPISVTYESEMPIWVPGRLRDHPNLVTDYIREMAAYFGAPPEADEPPILISIVMHTEEPLSGTYPDFVNDEAAFWEHRSALVTFTNMLHDHGVMFNYESDWNFLMAAGLYDAGTPETGGENVVRYIKDLGFEVDPHAHETQYTYADVAYLIQTLGVTPSHTTGGFLAAPPADSKLEYLWQPISATLSPTYTWQAEILWGGATRMHQNEEALWASGVWKPGDEEHFLQHAEAAPLPYVGGYGRNNCEQLIQKQQNGELETDKIHTCTLFVGQNELLQPGRIPAFAQEIEALDAAGNVRWVGLAEVIDIWESEYASEAHILPYLTAPVTDAVDSPFGFHPASVYKPGYPDNGFTDAQNVGVRWAREGVYALWFIVQPDLEDATYDFSLYDQQWGDVPPDIQILGNIAPQSHTDEGRCLPGSWLPVSPTLYTAFVTATVERYDGDGIDDMPGLSNPITYWQVGNEPSHQEHTDFAGLQLMTYQAIKAACADCTVLIGGVAGFPANYVSHFDAHYAPILAELNGQGMDVFDFHWYGDAEGDYRLADAVTGQDVLDHVRATLTSSGFSATLPIWITEMGAYSGDPAGPTFAPQTERQQAGDYFKRFIYPLSRGVKKIFPAFGLLEGFKHDDGYFDHTGLIYDGEDSSDLGLGVKKLSYYTYKKMTEVLAGADWDTLTLLHDGTDSDHLYSFRVQRDGAPIHIAWWDTFDEPGYTPGDTKPITLTGLMGTFVTVTPVVPTAEIGQEVTDYATAFTVTTHLVADGAVTIPLGEDPVLVEGAESRSIHLPLVLKAGSP